MFCNFLKEYNAKIKREDDIFFKHLNVNNISTPILLNLFSLRKIFIYNYQGKHPKSKFRSLYS